MEKAPWEKKRKEIEMVKELEQLKETIQQKLKSKAITHLDASQIEYLKTLSSSTSHQNNQQIGVPLSARVFQFICVGYNEPKVQDLLQNRHLMNRLWDVCEYYEKDPKNNATLLPIAKLISYVVNFIAKRCRTHMITHLVRNCTIVSDVLLPNLHDGLVLTAVNTIITSDVDGLIENNLFQAIDQRIIESVRKLIKNEEIQKQLCVTDRVTEDLTREHERLIQLMSHLISAMETMVQFNLEFCGMRSLLCRTVNAPQKHFGGKERKIEQFYEIVVRFAFSSSSKNEEISDIFLSLLIILAQTSPIEQVDPLFDMILLRAKDNIMSIIQALSVVPRSYDDWYVSSSSAKKMNYPRFMKTLELLRLLMLRYSRTDNKLAFYNHDFFSPLVDAFFTKNMPPILLLGIEAVLTTILQSPNYNMACIMLNQTSLLLKTNAFLQQSPHETRNGSQETALALIVKLMSNSVIIKSQESSFRISDNSLHEIEQISQNIRLRNLNFQKRAEERNPAINVRPPPLHIIPPSSPQAQSDSTKEARQRELSLQLELLNLQLEIEKEKKKTGLNM